MFSVIPQTVWYALPVMLFFVVAWIMQSRIYQKIDHSSEQETKISSEQAVYSLLEENNIKSVAVEASDNYTQNDYDREYEKIRLSPETIGRKDYTSIGYAFYAVERTIMEKNHPMTVQWEQKIHIAETITFWVVFCILAFGLMSCSLPMILFGYLCAFVPALLHLYTIYSSLSRLNRLFEGSKLIYSFNDAEKMGIRSVLRAIILKGSV